MPVPVIPIATTIASLVLPYIMQRIGGNLEARDFAKWQATQPQPWELPAGAQIHRDGNVYRPFIGNGPRGAARYGNWTPIPTPVKPGVYKPGMMGRIGGMGGVLGMAGMMALPFILNLVGRSAQAAGNTAGAAAQAVGNIPKHLANMTSAEQRARYGGTLFDTVGGIASDVGTAAGVGLAGAGNAIGSTAADAGQLLGMMNMMNMRDKRIEDMMRRIGPSVGGGRGPWDVLGRYISSQGFGRY